MKNNKYLAHILNGGVMTQNQLRFRSTEEEDPHKYKILSILAYDNALEIVNIVTNVVFSYALPDKENIKKYRVGDYLRITRKQELLKPIRRRT